MHSFRLPARVSFRWSAFVAVAALLLAGCVTDDQVKSIVRDSNYEMLLASAPSLETGGLPANPKDGVDSSVDAAAARLTAFLSAHSDDPTMASALRLRQSLLYLSHRAFALADGTFAQVAAGSLTTARDQALAAAWPDLRWWSEYALTTNVTFFTTEKDAALQHMSALATRAAGSGLAATPDLRDYFLEMRAWIGVKLGLAADTLAFSQSTLQDAADTWTSTFTPAELSLLASGDFKNVKPFDLSTRRILRARVLLTTVAAQTAGAPNAALTFREPAVQQFYASLPH